jgi:hypothetical protein
MKVCDLNEELLNELNLQDIKDSAKKVVSGTKAGVVKVKNIIVDEFKDNIEALKILKNAILQKFGKGVEVSDSDFKKAVDQLLKDNIKLFLLAGISVLPGSAVILPIAISIAKQFDIHLVPTKTFNI